MKFKTPKFWYREDHKAGLIETLLSPLSYLYQMLSTAHQNSKTPHKVDIPVICIGNINAGGTGKTPTALAVMDVIQSSKFAKSPHFLTRGYGATLEGPLLADPTRHDYHDSGDEALLLAQKAPTIVSRDRVAGAKLAIEIGADLIIMDDGLQNAALQKDLKLVVINGAMGFGNGKTLPAGPLRQSLSDGLNNADGFVIIGEDLRNVAASLPPATPLIRADLKQRGQNALSKNAYLAFAGLGYPQKFFDFAAQDCSLEIVEAITFPDHYPYTKSDLLDLKEKADHMGAKLLTTEKDALRLPPIDNIEVHTLPVSLNFEDETPLVELLKTALS